MRRLARDESGATAIITAVMGAVLAAIAALAVDLGGLYFEARRCQTAADLAALAAARDIQNATAAARATAEANVDASTIQVTRGGYRADPSLAVEDRFTASGGGSAVRVTVTTQAPLYFGAWIMGRDTIDVTRSATAAAEPMASYSIGSRLAGLNGGMANSLLSALTGSQVRLSVMDYRSLANADVSLLGYFDALATELGVEAGRYDQLLDERITAPRALGALADVLSDNGQDGEATLLRRLASSADARRELSLGQLFGLYQGLTPASLDVNIEALDLAQAALVAANQNRQLSLDLGADVGLAGLETTLAIGERPGQSPWMTVTNEAVVVRTAQTRLFIRARVGSGSGALALLNVPIFVELASAEARLDTLDCSPEAVTLDVRPSVGQIALGEVDVTRLQRFSEDIQPQQATLLNTLGLLRVKAFSQLRLGGDTWQEARFTRSQIDSGDVRTVSTDDLARALMGSLLNQTRIEVNILGLGIGLGTREVLGQQVAGLLAGLAAPLDRLLGGVSAITGAQLGQADVRVTGLRCGAPVLVG